MRGGRLFTVTDLCQDDNAETAELAEHEISLSAVFAVALRLSSQSSASSRCDSTLQTA